MEENELIRLLKNGDKRAFDELYEKYKDTALRMAYLICGNLADSQDIVQESFIRCYEHIYQLNKEEQFKSWFFHILTRTAWKYCKKQSKEIPEEEMISLMPKEKEASSLDVLMDKERDRELMDMINHLSVKHRTTLVLYYYNELSTKEIAHVLGCLEGTVKSRLFTARKLLKKTILEEKNQEAWVYGK